MGRRVVGGVLVMAGIVGLALYLRGSRRKPEVSAVSPQVSSAARSMGHFATVGQKVTVPGAIVILDLPPQRIAGRVIRDGQPVPDAFVKLRLADARLAVDDVMVRTGRDGRFDLGGFPAATFLVIAWTPGAT